MPRNDSDFVTVCGKSEDNVYDCVDQIRKMEDDYINQMIDRGVFLSLREEARKQEKNKELAPQKVEITGAPWQLDNFEQFPTMGGGSYAQNNSENSQPTPTSGTNGVWGNRRW